MPARDSVAAGPGGRDIRIRATTLYAAVRAGRASRVGPVRDSVAGGRGGARHPDSRNDPIRGCVGRQGPHGRAGAGQRGRQSWWTAECGFRATTLYAAVWAGRASRVGPVPDSAAGDRGGARHPDSRNDPIRGCVGRQRQQDRGLYATAWPVVVAGREMRISRNDPIRGWVDRRRQQGRGLRGTARPVVAAGRGMRISRNDPIRGCVDRQGRGQRGAGAAGGRGGSRNAVYAQRPYTRLRGPVAPAGACADSVAGGRDGARRAESRNDPIRGCLGRPGQKRQPFR